jgi:hypothetical protein
MNFALSHLKRELKKDLIFLNDPRLSLSFEEVHIKINWNLKALGGTKLRSNPKSDEILAKLGEEFWKKCSLKEKYYCVWKKKLWWRGMILTTKSNSFIGGYALSHSPEIAKKCLLKLLKLTIENIDSGKISVSLAEKV